MNEFQALVQQGASNAGLFIPGAILLGALATLNVRHVSKRWSGFGELARKAPYVSGELILWSGCMSAGR